MHSKSRLRLSSIELSSEKTIINSHDHNIPLSLPLDTQSNSEDDEGEDGDDLVDVVGNQLAGINCQDEQEQCDNSDSLDEALDAEQSDDENENNFI